MAFHASIRISDIDRSLEFYRAIGLEERGRFHAPEGRTVVFLDEVSMTRDSEFEYSLELNYAAGVNRYEMGTAYRHIGITTTELDAVLAALAEQGVEPEWSPNVPEGAKVRVCFVRDPDGYQVELIGH
jgi:lactoylglutathione lyase